jgi:hypothetical protein
MAHASGSSLKKISKKSMIKSPSRDRFENLVEGEFYNAAFKKNLLIFHECPARKGAFSVITG